MVLSEEFSEKSDKWTIHSGTWQVKNGKMYQEQHSHGRYISTAVPQEGHMTYEWEVGTTQNYISGGFTFCASNVNNMYGGNAYCLWFESNYLHLRKVQNNSGNQVAQYHFPQRPNRIKFKVEYDSDTGRIKVWANSKEPVMNYTDSSAWKSGSYILLVVNRPMNFDNLRVTLGQGIPRDMEKGSEETDLIHFTNRDRISGELESINKDKVTLSTDYGKINLDREKVSTIIFNKKKIVKPKLSEKEANLILHNLDKLTVNIQSLDEKVLSAESPYADLLKIDRSAINKIILPLKK